MNSSTINHSSNVIPNPSVSLSQLLPYQRSGQIYHTRISVLILSENDKVIFLLLLLLFCNFFFFSQILLLQELRNSKWVSTWYTWKLRGGKPDLRQPPGNVFTCKMWSTFPKVTSETNSLTCLCWVAILALVKTLTRSLQVGYKNKERLITVKYGAYIKWGCPQEGTGNILS